MIRSCRHATWFELKAINPSISGQSRLQDQDQEGCWLELDSSGSPSWCSPDDDAMKQSGKEYSSEITAADSSSPMTNEEALDYVLATKLQVDYETVEEESVADSIMIRHQSSCKADVCTKWRWRIVLFRSSQRMIIIGIYGAYDWDANLESVSSTTFVHDAGCTLFLIAICCSINDKITRKKYDEITHKNLWLLFLLVTLPKWDIVYQSNGHVINLHQTEDIDNQDAKEILSNAYKSLVIIYVMLHLLLPLLSMRKFSDIRRWWIYN